MSELWIQGCRVQRITFRKGLIINFDDDNELVISAPMHLLLPPLGNFPAELVTIDPHRVRNEERALFDFSGAMCTSAAWDDDGVLRVEFADGHAIDALRDDGITAWELYGKYHGYAACTPGGKVRVLRHDVPEEG